MLYGWVKKAKETGAVHQGSGNYASDEAKENARLRRESHDTKDALEILKKAINPLRLTKEIFSQTSKRKEELKKKAYRLNES